MPSPWGIAAQPRWWQECAREANKSIEQDAILEDLRSKYGISRHTWRILCGLTAMKGAEVAVKRLYAELHNPFPVGDEEPDDTG
jgi:hypothetical protein